MVPLLLLLGLGCQPPSSGSLRFDGVDDLVALEDLPGLPPQSWTVEAWIRPEPSAQQRPNIVARRSRSGSGDSFTFRLRRDFGGVLELGLANDHDSWGVAGSRPIPEGRWTHVAASWSQAEGRVSLFVDGSLDASGDCGLTPYAGPAPLWLGGDPLHGPTGRPFSGHIAELRIWDRALDASTLQGRMTARLQGDEPGLLLYWPATEGRGEQLRDHGPQGLEGRVGSGRQAPTWDPAAPF
jgi:hypothetical protein